MCDQGDVLADQAMNHPGEGMNRHVQVQNPALEYLLASESEQLLRQAGRTLSGRCDGLGVAVQWIGRWQFLEQKLGVSVDDGEQVIELVRHTTRQPADALQFLGFPQSLCEFGVLRPGEFSLTDVRDKTFGVKRLPLLVSNLSDIEGNPDRGSVPPN